MRSNPTLVPEVKQRWLKALREGGFEQAPGYLELDEKFCCLGVLCTIAHADEVVSRTVENQECGTVAYYATEGWPASSQVLPYRLSDWMFVDGMAREFDDNGSIYITRTDKELWGINDDLISAVGYDCFQVSLASLNDSGLSFDQIASIIEKYL